MESNKISDKKVFIPHKKMEHLEGELRPEYVAKIKRIEKANKKPITIKNIDDLLIDE